MTDIKIDKTPEARASSQEAPFPTETVVFVDIDCLFHLAGDMVSGEIWLSVPHAYPSWQLILQSKGKEWIKIYKGGSDTAETFKSTVYKFQEIVDSWDTLEAGKHVYPFTFKLPLFCPATFSFAGYDTMNNYIVSEIMYNMSALLKPLDKDDSIVIDKKILDVRSRNARQTHPNVQENNAVVQTCCFNKGTTALKVTLDERNQLMNGKQFTYKLYPDNTFWKLPISHVDTSVLMEVAFNTPIGKFYVAKDIYTCSRPTWIAELQSLIYEKDFEYTADLKYDKDNNCASNAGSLISWWFSITAQVYHQSSCSPKPVNASMPIHVNPNYSRKKEKPRGTEEWEPEEHPITKIVMSNTASMVNCAKPIQYNQFAKYKMEDSTAELRRQREESKALATSGQKAPAHKPVQERQNHEYSKQEQAAFQKTEKTNEVLRIQREESRKISKTAGKAQKAAEKPDLAALHKERLARGENHTTAKAITPKKEGSNCILM